MTLKQLPISTNSDQKPEQRPLAKSLKMYEIGNLIKGLGSRTSPHPAHNISMHSRMSAHNVAHQAATTSNNVAELGQYAAQQGWAWLTLRLALHTALLALNPPPKPSCHRRSPSFTPMFCSTYARMYLLVQTNVGLPRQCCYSSSMRQVAQENAVNCSLAFSGQVIHIP